MSIFPNRSGFLLLLSRLARFLGFILRVVSNNFLRLLACLVALPKTEGVMSVVFRPAPICCGRKSLSGVLCQHGTGSMLQANRQAEQSVVNTENTLLFGEANTQYNENSFKYFFSRFVLINWTISFVSCLFSKL